MIMELILQLDLLKSTMIPIKINNPHMMINQSGLGIVPKMGIEMFTKHT